MESIIEIFPDAPIYTGIYSPKNLTKNINSREIISANNLLLRIFSKHLSFLMPLVFESFDLDDFDIIISDSSSWSKGVITKPRQLHISYIHTPPRFLYGYSVESPSRHRWYYKPVIAIIDHFLRIWDYCAAQRPDYLIANSETTRKRIKKFYGRYAEVINPPLDIDDGDAPKPDNIKKPYFCSLGRLTPYKNVDLLIQAFNFLGWDLIVMGTGPDEKRLRKMSGDSIKMTGRVGEEKKRAILAGSKGLIFPVVEEDWGIVPLEAMSLGKPVLAHKSGGATETVKENITGMFFESLELEDIIISIKEFDKSIERGIFEKERIKAYAKGFKGNRFQKEFSNFVKKKWEDHAGIS